MPHRIQTYHIGEITIYIVPIPADGGSRSDREAIARDLILDTHLPGQTVSHHADGAPYLTVFPAPAISISHCVSHYALAVGPVSLHFGIDIETPRTQLLRIALRFLSPADLTALDLPDNPSEEDLDTLLLAWTSKEAAYKAVHPQPPTDLKRDIRLLSPDRAVCHNRHLVLHHLPLGKTYLTLAVEPPA